MARRGCVHHDEVVAARGVNLEQPLHGDVVVALHELGSDVRVQRVGQDGVARAYVGRVAAHEVVPALLGVEHRHPELATRLEAGGGEGVGGDACLHVAESLESERARQAPGRIDGEHEDPSAEVRRGHGAEGGGDRGLADAARPAHDGDLLGGKEALDRTRHGSSSASASATCDVARIPVVRANRYGTHSIGSDVGSASRRVARFAARRRRNDTASSAASNTPATPGPAATRSSPHGTGARRRSNTSSSARPNSSGSTRLTTTAVSSTFVSACTRPASSMVSTTGISSVVVTITRPVTSGSSRMARIHRVWSLTTPTCTSSWIVCGAASCPTMWPVATASTTTRS